MPQFTLGDIDDRVLDRLDQNDGLYPQLERYRAINDAIRVINLFTGFTNSTTGVPGFTVPGQLIYQTPPGIIFPQRVYFEGRQLERISIRSISMRFRNWTTDRSNQGTPVQRWIPLGIGMFAIHPTDAAGGKELDVNGVSEPPWLGAATDTITLEDEWMTLVENLAAHAIQLKESAAIFAAASLLYQDFLRGIRQYMYWSEMKMPSYYLKMGRARQKEELGDGQ